MPRWSMLVVNMPADLAASVKRLADKNDRSVKAEIRRALREYIDRQDEADKNP